MSVLWRRARSAALLLAVTACDYVALSFDGGTGLVVISIIDDDRPSSGGYRIRTRQAGVPDRIMLITHGGQLQLELPGPAPVELTLLAPSGCRVVGPNPQVLTPASERAVRASFTLECTGI